MSNMASQSNGASQQQFATTLHEELKAEANELYKRNKFSAADRKYSEALAVLDKYLHLMNTQYHPNAAPATENEESTAEDSEDAIAEQSTKLVKTRNDEDGDVLMNGNDAKPTVDQEEEKDPHIAEIQKAIAVILCNRALSRLRLEQYGAALLDATTAIQQCPSYTKGFYRRGSANFALGRHKDALKDFKKVCKLFPNDKDAVTRRKECEKILKEIAFSEAIDSGRDKVSIADTIDITAYPVDEAYGGPRLPEDGTVTLEFVQELITAFKTQQKLPTRYAIMIILAAKRIFDKLPTIVDVEVRENAKITVCGDTHGQYYDLCNIFDINGLPSLDNPYLFNGDFVDRGSFSVELILTLFAIKAWSSESIHLTRGNHEACSMNMLYGFEGEVKAKYSPMIYELFAETFRSLPLACILDGSSARYGKKAFVLHGGLFSRDGVTLQELRAIDRFREPDTGLMAEMLWSDPQKQNGRGPSKRGTGIAFGPDVTCRFLEENGLDLVVRSHEMKEEGYEVEADGKLITIFSAPNYCDQIGNKGAFITFQCDMEPVFTQFEAVPHPNVPAMTYANRLRLMGI